MSIKERVDAISEYFLLFTIQLDASYILIKFPSKWIMPEEYDERIILNKDAKRGLYLYTEPENDPMILFDLVDEVIELNKTIEAKRKLLMSKVEELKEIFASEDLDTLNSLEFNFDNNSIDIKDKKTENKVEFKEITKDIDQEEEKEPEEKVTVVKEESAIMKMAKSIVK